MPFQDESAEALETARRVDLTGPASARLDAAELVERHGDLVYNLALRLTGDAEEARDLAQDSFVRLLKGASTFRGEATVKTWVCQVVINCHRNRGRWWRRLKRGRTVSLEERWPGSRDDAPTIGSTLADVSPGPDRVAEGGDVRSRVRSALACLQRDQRAALILREVEGMSYAEIAVVLGVREGTVKSRLARARESLRVALGDLVGSPQGGVEP